MPNPSLQGTLRDKAALRPLNFYVGGHKRGHVVIGRGHSMDVIELIDRYCRVWNETDPSIRAKLLTSLWASNATYTDPSIHASNAEELLAHIAAVRVRRPAAAVLRTSAVDTHHGVARFAWHVVQSDGSALPEGIDIAFISSDGTQIERIIGFFGPLARTPN